MTQTNKDSPIINQTGKQDVEISTLNKSSTPDQPRLQTNSKEGTKRLLQVPAKKLTKALGPSPCPLCPKVFDTPENLQKHTNFRHPGAKLPLVAIGTETNKLKEIKNLKGYQCPLCDKMFSSVNYKENHMQKYHGDINPNLDPLNTDTENLLNAESLLNKLSNDKTEKVVTETEGGATIETEEIHETTDLCGYCGDKFDNLDILNEHIAMMHA